MRHSKHSVSRSQQRGAPPELVDLIINNGTVKYRRDNAVGYMITNKQADMIIQQTKDFLHKIEHAKTIEIRTTECGLILTIIRKA